MDASKIRVEIWSDFTCPFCYIGKHSFEVSLKAFEHKDQVEVIYKSFEIDPNSQKSQTKKIHEYLSDKYGMSQQQAKDMNAQIGKQGKPLGIDFNFDGMILTNSFDAHRVMHYAKQHGKSSAMTERLMKAYFADGVDIGLHETLIRLAKEVGLDENEVRTVLSEGKYAEEVRKDKKEAANRGISGVPYFLINGKDVISESRSSDVFARALEKAWKEGISISS